MVLREEIAVGYPFDHTVAMMIHIVIDFIALPTNLTVYHGIG